MASYSQKMVKKSAYWHRHGKHAKIDPAIERREWKRPKTTTVWFESPTALFADIRGRRCG